MRARSGGPRIHLDNLVGHGEKTIGDRDRSRVWAHKGRANDGRTERLRTPEATSGREKVETGREGPRPEISG